MNGTKTIRSFDRSFLSIMLFSLLLLWGAQGARGAILDSLNVDSNGYILQEDLIVTGDVTVNGGILDINGFTLTVNGSLTVTGNDSRLKMVNAADVVEVLGDVTFSGASTIEGVTQYLSAGELRVGGDFTQAGTSNTYTSNPRSANNKNSFTATGTHKAIFNGPGPQTVSFDSTSAQFSHFHNLEISKTGEMVTLLSDEGETVSGNFSPEGSWGISTTAYSGNGSWADSPVGNYANGVDTSLTSTTLDLTDAKGSYLTFWHRYDVEQNKDYCKVEVSDDNGSTWAEAASLTGQQTRWEPRLIDLSPYDGQSTVKIRFRLISDPFTNADGWYIDKIRVRAGPTIRFSSNVYVAGQWTLQNDQTIKGDFTILGGAGDMNGHALTVDGDWDVNESTVDINTGSLTLFNLSIASNSSFDVNGGSLDAGRDVTIYGSFDLNGASLAIPGELMISGHGSFDVNGGISSIGGDLTVSGGGAYLKMVTAGVVDVAGNAMFWGDDTSLYLTAGTLKVGGNFAQQSTSHNNYDKKSFLASGTHKVILDGTSLQTVSFANPNNSYFQDLEITNTSTEGVNFTSPFNVAGAFTCDVATNLVIPGVTNFGMTLLNNVSATGDFTVDGPLDLAGQSLSIDGSLTINSSGSLDISGGSLSVGENVNVSGAFDLEGADLTIPGSLTISGNGYFDVNGGNLTVEGDLTVSGGGAYLKMVTAGVVDVAGNAMFWGDDTSPHLTAGTLKVGGNFTQQSSSSNNYDKKSFLASGTHKVILDGTSLQTVSFANPSDSYFQDLEVTNISTEGVTFASPLTVAGTFAYDAQTKLDFSGVSSFGLTLLHDVSVTGDLTVDGPMDLAGQSLSIDGSLTINSSGSLDVNGGSLDVVGDVTVYGSFDLDGTSLTIPGNLTISGYGLFDVNGGTCSVGGNLTVDRSGAVLKMVFPADMVAVAGNALFRGGRTYWVDGDTTYAYLSAGTLKVGGDFTQEYSGSPLYYTTTFLASGTHKVILNGTSAQTVSFANPSDSYFQDLEVTNISTEGVTFASPLTVAGTFVYDAQTKLDFSGVSSFGLTLLHDVSVTGDLTVDGPMDLAGQSLSIDGSLTINSSGSLDVNGGSLDVVGDVTVYGSFDLDGTSLTIPGNLTISGYGLFDVNGGTCSVGGNLTVDRSGAVLKMVFPADMVAVAGNALFRGDRTYWVEGDTTYAYLSAGTLKIRGNLTQQNSGGPHWYYTTFVASGTHKVVLDGTSLQTVSFANPNNSYFQDLEITNTSAEGVTFTSPLNVAGAFISAAQSTLNISEIQRLTLTSDLDVAGDLTVSGPMDLAGRSLMVLGNLNINSNSSLYINGGSCSVTGDLSVSGYGAYLRMVNDADVVEVAGNVTFNGASSKDFLTAGVLRTEGDFYQKGTLYSWNWSPEAANNKNSFTATGTHKVIFNGTGPQTVSFETSSAEFSHFQNLEITNTSLEGVSFLPVNEVVATGGYYLPGMDPILGGDDLEWDAPFQMGYFGGVTSPAFADLDGDGDQDLFGGQGGGTIRLFENILANPRPGKMGLGKDFTGSNFAQVPDAPDLRLGASFTIEFWIKVDSISQTWTGVIGKSNSTSNGRNYTIRLHSAKYLQFSYHNDAFQDLILTTPPDSILLGQWHHVAVVFDIPSDTMKIYIDGALQGSGTPAGYPVTNDSSVWIGRNVDGAATEYFDGVLDEIRISHVVRYDTEFTPPNAPFEADANTVALWHLDELGTLELVDSSGKGHDGTWTPWSLKSTMYADIDVGEEASPTFADLDADGDLDLFIGSKYGQIWFYENEGSRYLPSWKTGVQLRNEMSELILPGNHTSPALVDIDGDDKLDLFIGYQDQGTNIGAIAHYKNTGTIGAPVWVLVTDTFSGISLQNSIINPLFADLDRDDDYELLFGKSDGTLTLFRNIGTSSSPTWALPIYPYADFGSGSECAPAFADVDGDGVKDLLVGDNSGYVHMIRNVGVQRIVINAGQPITASQDVTLTLDGAGMEVAGYLVSNGATTPDPAAQGWVAVGTSTSFVAIGLAHTLEAGDGLKRVHVWFKDSADNLYNVAYDTIILDQTHTTRTSLDAALPVDFNQPLTDQLPDKGTAKYYAFLPGDWQKLILRFDPGTAGANYRVSIYHYAQSLDEYLYAESFIGYNLNELIRFDEIPTRIVVKVEWIGDADPAGDYSLEMETAATTTAGTMVWAYETGGIIRSSPVVSGGKVYVGSYDGRVYGLDAQTGVKIWTYETGEYVLSAPVVRGDRVYVSSYDGKLYSLDAATGGWLWEYQIGSGIQSSPAVKGGKIYVGSGNTVYCLDAETGEKLWDFQGGGDMGASSPTVSDGRVYVGGGYNNKVYALDASTGEKLWEYHTGGYVQGSPAVMGGRVYLGSSDYKVYALDAQTGAWLWDFETEGNVGPSSPSVGDGMVYIGGGWNDEVYALDATTGEKLWEFQTGSSYLESSPAVSAGKVYIGGGYDYKVYALDATRGEKLWEFQTGGTVFSSPAVTDGLVYIGSDDKKVYCLDAGDPNATGWSMYGRDLTHSANANLQAETEALFIEAPAVVFWSEPANAYHMKAFLQYTDLTIAEVTASVDTWSVSDINIATVDPSGLLTPVDAGEVTVTATHVADSKTYLATRRLMVMLPGADLAGGTDPASAAPIAFNTASHDDLPDSATAHYYTFAPGDWEKLMFKFYADTTSSDYGVTLVDGYQDRLFTFEVYNGVNLAELISFTTIPSQVVVKVEAIGDYETAGSYSLEIGTAATSTAGQRLWEFETGGAVYSSPSVSAGRVYVGSDDGNVYGVDIATGAKVWAYTTGGSVQSAPAVSGGKVYVGSDDGKLYCLNAANGAWLWEYGTVDTFRSSPAVSGGRVYVGSNDWYLYSLDAQTGAKLWEYQTGGYIPSSPVVIGGKVYVGCNDGKVYSLDAQTGARLWEYQTGDQITSSPAVSGGKVYIGGLWNEKLYCLDATTGDKLWEFQMTGGVQSSPAVSDGKVYVGTWDSKVWSLDAETGRRLWVYDTGRDVSSSPAVAGGRVFIGSLDQKLHCLDARTGIKLWDYQTGGGIYPSSPAVSEGRVYVGSNDKKLYALDAGDPSADGWPMFRHDLQHTGDTAHHKTQFLYGLIQAEEITPFSEYELRVIEVYEDNDFAVSSGVQFSVSNPTIASISGNRLTATSNGRVVVSADYDAKHFQRILFVMVSADDLEGWDNDTKEKADDLPPDEFWQGDMISGAGDDVDYYKLTIGQDSLVDIGYLVEGSIADTRLELFDATDNLLISAASLNGQNKILSTGLTAGTYYLKLTPAGDVDQNSSYYISYTLVAPLGPAGPVQLSLGETKEATVYSLTDAVYFQFQLTEIRNLDILFTPTSLVADYQIDLLDPQDNLIKQLTAGNGLSGTISVALLPGEYTIKVTCTGDVDAGHPFSLSLNSSPKNYEVEPNDTWQTATGIGQDMSIKGFLDDNDLDFYGFSLEAPRYIKLDFVAETYGTAYDLTLYKGDDQNPIDSTICQKGSSAFIEVGLTAGNYYLKVAPSGDKEPHPSYIVTLSESTSTQLEIESNNTLLFANALDSTHPKQARIYSDSDVDYYGFYVPEQVRVEIAFTSESSTADYMISITNGEETSVYQKTSTNGAPVDLTRKLPAGNFYVKVEPGDDVDPHAFYNLSTTTLSLTGLKTLVGIRLDAQADQVDVAGTLQIGATGDYSDATQGPISGATWSSSDETVATVTQNGLVTGVSDGYVIIYASLEGQVGQISLTVGVGERPDYQTWGNLILVAGGGVAATNLLRESTQYLSDMVYAKFLARGFEEKDIYYFNPIPWHDINGDGYGDHIVSDDSPTVDELKWAIEEWAAEQPSTGPLYVALINHGGIDTFEVFPGEVITASELDNSFSLFETATGRSVVVLIEACKSGSLVDDLAPAGSNRMVITCTDEGNAYLELKGRISFTQFFMDNLFSGDTFRQSFLKTTDRLGNCGRPYSLMSPQLAEGIEFTLSQTRLGGNFAIAGIFPEILDQTQDLEIQANTPVAFSATISDLSGQTDVWAVVEPPDYIPPPVVQDLTAPQVTLPTFDLVDEDNGVLDGVFVGSYSDFTHNGQYKIVFYARNADGLVTLSPPTVVTVFGGIEFSVDPGDVNNDETVDLVDAILVLQLLSGIQPSTAIYYQADVNGDGRIGIEELIYILQILANLRN